MVFYRDGAVFRGISAKALQDWEQLSASAFFRAGTAQGRIVATERVPPGVESRLRGEWAAVLEHARIPFVSYPYEWTFSMLKDAALLHLELLAAALECGMIMKDSSAYNVQWQGAQPCFVDIPSFERLRPGQPWVGYRQFCEQFLYPLMLQAYKGADFRPWLRGSIDGIPARTLRPLLSNLRVPVIACSMPDTLAVLGLSTRNLPLGAIVELAGASAPLVPSAPLPAGTTWRGPLLPVSASFLDGHGQPRADALLGGDSVGLYGGYLENRVIQGLAQ